MKKKKILFTVSILAVLGATIMYQGRFIIADILPDGIKSKLDIITKIPKNNRGIYFPLSVEHVKLNSDNVKIRADLYKAHSKAPGIVLLHGSSPWGRKLALYPLLAKELNKRGYTVLNIDLRGFGDSEDPKEIKAITSWNFNEDVRQAVSYLENFADIDTSRIFIIGHSFGGEIAITAGIADKRVKKIVSIGPGRRRQERILSENATDRDYYLKRFSNDTKIKEPLPLDVLLTLHRSIMIDSHLRYFTKSSHKPLFLIDGELEDDKDKIFLKGIYDQIKEPKKYITLTKSDHYCNTTSLFGIIFYDKSIMNTLVESIDSWLKA